MVCVVSLKLRGSCSRTADFWAEAVVQKWRSEQESSSDGKVSESWFTLFFPLTTVICRWNRYRKRRSRE